MTAARKIAVEVREEDAWAAVAARYASATPKRDAVEHYYAEVRVDDSETDPYFREAFR